jgi:hypothetical protein
MSVSIPNWGHDVDWVPPAAAGPNAADGAGADGSGGYSYVRNHIGSLDDDIGPRAVVPATVPAPKATSKWKAMRISRKTRQL